MLRKTNAEVVALVHHYEPGDEDIVHYGKMVVSLRETIHLMGEVGPVVESAGSWAVR